ncbi:PREDICTED: disease resistance protein RPS2-like isoform X2 [Ipomoea nil]|uniref:disease resistance protein RPS2-like isoform X2 n=1 Tax=Ipomoea nil TaxID=35883 RepID=UPI0009020038|nr:PREDICTED: disease resistance protein RPS2-like isoform X2 [Ipomoea nil]
MKKLSQALLQNLKNLETLTVAYCEQLEEIIGGGVGDEEEGIEGSSNTLPKLKLLRLEFLPELKSICNGREMICPSIERIIISHCKNIKRMPSIFPIDDATRQPYLPSSFERIDFNGDEKEWWESLEFHNPNAKHFLESHIKWYW